MGDSSADEDYGAPSGGRGARLQISRNESRSAIDLGDDYDLGQAVRFDTYTISLFVTNVGNIAATDISVPTLPSGFSFRGGNFPGTQGTCQSTLQVAETCRLVLLFSPTTVGKNTAEFSLNYTTGRQSSNLTAQAIKNITAQVYSVSPTITSISPSQGSRLGGTTLTITGAHLTDNMQVSLGSSSCESVTRVNTSTITCVTTAHAAGSADLAITNDIGDTTTSSGAFYFLGPPTVSAVLPTGGALAGGTSITLTGTNFTSGMTVSFGGSDCSSVTISSSTSATCVTSAHAAGVVDLTVTASDTQSGTLASGYTYRAAPTVSTVTYSYGATAGGNSETITGTGFLSGATVSFGGSDCGSVTVNSSTSITCITSSHAAGSVNVIVTNPDGQSGTKTNGYSYGAPVVSAVLSPSSGASAGGTSVTITGTRFAPGASVTLGGVACTSVNVVSTVSLTCITGAHAVGSVTAVVTNSDGQSGSRANSYTYSAPTVTSISPAVGSYSGNTSVTITGTLFVTGATVTVGGVSCTSVAVVSSTSITCTTGAHSIATVDIVVTNPDAVSGTKYSGYFYQGVTVSTVSPNVGAAAGGTSVTITGAQFSSGATVSFGGTACASVSVVSSTSITCVTAARAASTVSVIVSNSDGGAGSKASAFTYQNPPTVTSVSPTSGTMAGGTALVITGTGFTSTVSGVTVGGSACTSVVRWSSTEVRCNTPSGSPGAVSVIVTNNDSQTASGSFTYVDPYADLWTALSTTSAPTARYAHTAVWTGSKMIIFGGSNGGLLNDGGIYNPVTDSWSALTTTDAPSQRSSHTAVWSYDKMVVWGGANGTTRFNTGAVYDPIVNSWTAMTTTNAPEERTYHTAAANFNKMFVVAGSNLSSGQLNTGGIYDIRTDTWTSISTTNAPSPRNSPSSHWTGRNYFVWGGNTNTGALYSPINDTWTTITTTGAPSTRSDHSSVWTGAKVLIWGGSNLNDGSSYDPLANSWTSITTTGAPAGRSLHSAVWSGGKMIIFGGNNSGTVLNSIGVYEPTADSWETTTTISPPSTRQFHSVVWTGNQMLVWGGTNGSTNNTGASYSLRFNAAGSWSTMNTVGKPSNRSNAQIFWTGSKMLVWGSNSTSLTSGGLYDPTTDSWTSMNSTGSIAAYQGTVAWTGSKLLAWGGDDNSNTGKIYDPQTDSWSSMTTSGAPTARHSNFGAWCGTRLLVFRGSNSILGSVSFGGSYDPDTDSWTAMSTGGTYNNWGMSLVCGNSKLYTYSSGGYSYDVLADSWTSIGSGGPQTAQYGIVGVWTGAKAIFWGGCVAGVNCYEGGGVYDPESNTWTTMVTTNSPRPQDVGSYNPSAAAAWTGSRMLVWGTYGTGIYNGNAGALYDPTANSWSTLSTTNLPGASGSTNTGVWTGAKMLLWGGSTNGLVYTP